MTSDAVRVAAVDLGATSGRVILGEVGQGEVRMRQVARFPNGPVALADGLHWNVVELYRSVLAGLREVDEVAAIGIDSWAVDYALLRRGTMLGVPFHYRDERNARAAEALHARIPFAELYARNGLQYLPFNTVYQFAAEVAAGGAIEVADRALLIPDLLAFWLTGAEVAERTNASTTGLLGLGGEWDLELAGRVGVPAGLLPPLVDPGDEIGVVRGEAASATGLGGVPVLAVGSHDTASAVVGVPMTDPDVAFISCGTWGLVGVELAAPLVTDSAREANFTNERGVDGRTRFLKNVMGLWVLSETVREWEREGEPVDLTTLLAAARDVTAPQPVFDVADPVFAAPGDMATRIRAWLSERAMPVPATRAELAVHLVGGGSLNELLCQLTADRAGLPVIAGPVEATALGNVVVQARALGAVSGSLESLRALIAGSVELRRYEPRVGDSAAV
jgi:rhamnulokinase